MVEAARQAQALDFIEHLPRGFDTLCGERGRLLSGGQRQRIAIARALLTNAPILLFDESSSNLDIENEDALLMVLRQMRVARSLLFITHRPAVMRYADRVLHLQSGALG